MTPSTIIVGGGIAGLAVAYELHRLGVSFRLLERAPRPGGVILSEEIDGYTIDGGPDALLIQKPDAIRLCEELGLGSRLVPTKPPRTAYIQRGGRLHQLPPGSMLGFPTAFWPLFTTRLFSWPGKARMAAEVLVPPRRDDRDESIGDFVTRRFGREATTYLAEPLLAGIHAGDVDKLSVRALFPRLAETEKQYGSLIRAFRHAPAGGSRNSEGAFRSLPGGLSEMVDALVAALPSGAVALGQTVSRIEALTGGGWRIEANGQSLDSRAMVLATPAFVTGRLMRSIDAELSRLCGEIPYASTGTVAMGFVRSAVTHPLDGSGFVVPKTEGTGILAASWLSSKWPDRAPSDRVLMRTFVGGARDPHALDADDAALVERSLAALTPLLGLTGRPAFTRVYRWERANAQHEVGHLDRVKAIERSLAAHPGLFLTGSGFRGVGIPDCVADGRRTAGTINEWLKSSAAR